MGKTNKDKRSRFLDAAKTTRDRNRPRAAMIEDEIRKAERRSNRKRSVDAIIEDAYLELREDEDDFDEEAWYESLFDSFDLDEEIE